MKPEQRTKNLLRYFGWQGGTIHQISRETGISVQDLLYGTTDKKNNKDFWLGVAMSEGDHGETNAII